MGCSRERRRRGGRMATDRTARRACLECPGSTCAAATKTARLAPKRVQAGRSSSAPKPTGASDSKSTMDVAWSVSSASRRVRPGRLPPLSTGRLGTTNRSDLVFGREDAALRSAESLAESRKGFRRSLHIRHVDAGSCNGCESELQALNNPFYNLHRFGIFFTPSPRFADLLLVTGPVTYAMRDPLLRTYEAMPEPRWVMAVGACAISGGVAGGGYACANGLEGILPVDLYLPGCPPNPAALIGALLMFLERSPRRSAGGRHGE